MLIYFPNQKFYRNSLVASLPICVKVAIHIGEYAFAHGSFYVALSRVKSLDNIIFFFGRTEWPDEGPIFHVNQYIQHAQELQADNE